MSKRANEQGTLDEKIVMDISGATPALENLIKLVGNLDNKFTKLLDNQALKQKTQEAQKQAREQEKLIKEQAKKWDNFKKALNVTGAVVGLVTLGKKTFQIAQEAINATETYNLFAVSLEAVTDEFGNVNEASSKYYTQAMAFQNKMNEKLGTNKAELMDYQAMYFSMLKSQIGNKDASYFMSEQLTKAGYDIASLYNLTVEDSMQKLQSGLAGQIEPLRKIGIDISESSLSGILSDLGIEKSVQQLSYGEKEVARYIAILRQAGQAQGDFARTIDQPANQIKMFQSQLAELKQVVGSFFVGLFGNIMPYINAIVMTLKEILKAIGGIFGISFSGLSSNLGSTNNQIGEIGSGIGNATKKAKEFNKQIMSWDEIHNITPPNGSSGGNGGGSAGSEVVDSRLLDALKEWDNQMDSVRNKATEIRDKMLEWLGFKRTDKGGWELEEGFNNFRKILEVVQGIGLAIGTWKVSSTIAKLLSALGIVNNKNGLQFATGLTFAVTGAFFLWNGTKHLMDGNWDLFTILETMFGGGATTIGIASMLKATKLGKIISWGQALTVGLGITFAIQGFEILTSGISTGDIKKTIIGALELVGGIAIPIATTIVPNLDKIKSGFGKLKDTIKSIDFKSVAGHVKTTTVSFAGLGVSMFGAYESAKLFQEGTIDSTTAIAGLSLSVAGATASGALFGSQFGIVGTVIGGSAGLILSAISAFSGLQSIMSEAKNIANEMDIVYSEATKEFTEYQTTIESLTSSMDTQLNSLGKNSETINICKEKLSELVDENGNVVGSTENVQIALNELNSILGTNFEIVNGKIANNGELMSSYNQLSNVVDDYSDRYVLNTLKQIAIDKKSTAIKRIMETTEANRKATTAYEEYKNKMLEYMNEVDKNGVRNSKETRERLQQMQSKLDELGNQVTITSQDFNDAQRDMNYSTDEMVEDMIYNYDLLGYMSEDTAQIIRNASDKATEGVSFNVDSITKEIEKGTNSISTDVSSKSKDIVETAEEANKDLNNVISEMGNTAVETVNESGNNIVNSVDNTAKKTVNTTNTLSKEVIKEFSMMAYNSEKEFNAKLSEMDKDTQTNILKSLVTTNGMKPEYVTAFANLATQSTDKYNALLEELPRSTRKQVQNAVDEVQGKKQALNDAVTFFSKGFDSLKNTNLANTASGIVGTFINGIKSKSYEVNNTASNIANNVSNTFYGIDTYGAGSNIINGLKNGMNNNKWKLSNVISSIANSIPNAIKKLLGIHSPSRVMMALAKFIPLGMAEGIDSEANTVYDSMNKLSKGIEVSASDTALGMTIGLNKQIQQNVDTKTTATVNGVVANNIKDIFTNAISSTNVNVRIEAKTEEGVIVKKSIDGINDYIIQNGDMPFPMLI